MCDVREGAPSEVAGRSSVHSVDVRLVVGSTDVGLGAGVSGQEQGWPGPMKLAMGMATVSNREDGGNRVVGSPRLMLDQVKDGDSCGVSLKDVRPFSITYSESLMGLMY
jgi:hypothetical protein